MPNEENPNTHILASIVEDKIEQSWVLEHVDGKKKKVVKNNI